VNGVASRQPASRRILRPLIISGNSAFTLETPQSIYSSPTRRRTPDIVLYESVALPMDKLAFTKVVVYSDGSCSWSRPGGLTGAMKYDLTDFPYDKQVVEYKLGSWAYDEGTMALTASQATVDIANYIGDHEWDLTNTRVAVEYKLYGCCPNPYSSIHFYVYLSRKPFFYLLNLVVPAALISILGVACFVVPWDGGERVTLMVTTLLTLTVYVVLVIENLPFTGTAPFLSRSPTSSL